MMTKHFTRLAGVAVAAITAAIIIPIASVGAEEVIDTYTVSVDPNPTNWSEDLEVPLFNPELGELIDVTVTLTPSLEGSMGVENSSQVSACVATLSWGAALTLTAPAASLEADASQTETVELGVFDGVVDFGGTSGATVAIPAVTVSAADVIDDAAELPKYEGDGTVVINVSTAAASTATGCGNIVQMFTTVAAAEVSIAYRYETPSNPAIDIETATNGVDADNPTGPEIPVGDPVTWTYVVTNTGDVDLTNVVVTDDQGVTVTCPTDQLAVGESTTCTANGTAEVGQYANLGSVIGTGTNGTDVTDTDPSHYIGVEEPANPAIDIETATNGVDADNPTGPEIPVGDPVTWTYVVTNTGDVDLTNVVVTDDQGVTVTCPTDQLAVGESTTCTANGTAEVGQYANLGSVIGTGTNGTDVTDTDPSHYIGVEEPANPAIDIETATNGVDADNPTGPEIPVGDPVTWTYVVTNTGDVDLTNVVVTDDQGVTVTCPTDQLAVGESTTCTANGTAEVGQYANLGSVIGTGTNGTDVTDTDPSHYIGVEEPANPAIDIETATNGVDADNPTGPEIPVGDPVTWTYVVTNTGDVDLTNVVVTDDQGVTVTCPTDQLAVGESTTCTANGTAEVGQYANLGSVIGTGTNGTDVTDTDPSHYIGVEEPANPAIDIETATNGVDADNPTGPEIPVGDPVTWTYVVTNTGDVDLTNVVVTDDQGVTVTCPTDQLAVGESTTCTANGTAEVGQYANLGSVIGTGTNGTNVTDTDPSHYIGIEDDPYTPAIHVEKYTNGADADEAPGIEIPVGNYVTWTYVVTNTGDLDLTNVTVSDDQGVYVSCPKDTLAVGASMTCTGSGIAEEGPYSNIGTASGTAPNGTVVTDTDPSHYMGIAKGW